MKRKLASGVKKLMFDRALEVGYERYAAGKAGAGAQVVTRTGFWWEVSQEDKFVMRKPLGFTWGQSDLA